MKAYCSLRKRGKFTWRSSSFLPISCARRQARPTLFVELHWLWLDVKQRDHLLAGHVKPSNGQVSLTVDRKRLRHIAREVPGFHCARRLSERDRNSNCRG